MKILLDIPDDLVVRLLSNSTFSGDINERIVAAARAVTVVDADVVKTRKQVFDEICDTITKMPSGKLFNLAALTKRYVLSDGDRRQIGKELKAAQVPVGFTVLDHNVNAIRCKRN